MESVLCYNIYLHCSENTDILSGLWKCITVGHSTAIDSNDYTAGFQYNNKLRLLLIVGSLTDNIAGSVLDFHIYLADILTYNPETDKLDSTHETHDTYSTCPSGDGIAQKVVNHSPDNTNEAYN